MLYFLNAAAGQTVHAVKHEVQQGLMARVRVYFASYLDTD